MAIGILHSANATDKTTQEEAIPCFGFGSFSLAIIFLLEGVNGHDTAAGGIWWKPVVID